MKEKGAYAKIQDHVSQYYYDIWDNYIYKINGRIFLTPTRNKKKNMH